MVLLPGEGVKPLTTKGTKYTKENQKDLKIRVIPRNPRPKALKLRALGILRG
jgi:hypothetical protein